MNVIDGIARGTQIQTMQAVQFALALTAALSWLDVSRFFIDTYVKIHKDKGLWLLLNAVLVTVVVVIIMAILNWFMKKKTIYTGAVPFKKTRQE